MNGVIES